MDKLIAKIVEMAIAEGIIETKNKLIQDSIHNNIITKDSVVLIKASNSMKFVEIYDKLLNFK